MMAVRVFVGIVALSCTAWIVGCADDGTVGEPGPRTMSAPDGGGSITPPSATPPAAPSMCAYGTEPSAPTVAGEFAILGGTEMIAPPAPTGGDPSGIWVASGMTVYLPDFARGQVDPEMSVIAGTGWFAFESGRFRFHVDVDLTIVTMIVGTIRQASGGGATGAYSMEGNEIVFAPDCMEMADSGELMGEISRRNGFSRTGDTGRLVVRLDSMLGTATLVVELRKVG